MTFAESKGQNMNSIQIKEKIKDLCTCMVDLNCSFSCPFCKAASYGVFYRGAKTTEERHRELEVTFVNITMNCYFFHRLKFTDLF